MYFKQFYLGCLAHASYLIGCHGEAVVIDPQRDVDLYIDEAARENLAIKHVIETHLHADFVSGHRELARRTGGKIYFGYKAGAKFEPGDSRHHFLFLAPAPYSEDRRQKKISLRPVLARRFQTLSTARRADAFGPM